MEKAKSSEEKFFLYYTIVLFLIVFFAFAPGFLDPESRGLPFYMHVHGAVLVGWFLLLIFQSWLIRSVQFRTHRKVGVFAALYGYLLAPGALLATFNVVSRYASKGISLDTNMSEVNPALGEGMSFLDVASEVVWTNIMAICTFVTLLTAAILLRKDPVFHKRLILLATVSIMGPALARLSRLPFLGGEQGPFIPAALLTLILTIIVYDFMRFKRVTKATWMATALIMILNGAGFYISGTEQGLNFVRSLA